MDGNKVPSRLAVLTGHISPSEPGVPSAQASKIVGGQLHMSETSAETWHQQCYNFQPGKLLLDQVGGDLLLLIRPQPPLS